MGTALMADEYDTRTREGRVRQAREILDNAIARGVDKRTIDVLRRHAERDARVAEAFGEGRPVKLIIELEVAITDPEWDEQTLIENAAIYFSSVLSDAEQREYEHGLERGEEPAYVLDPDLTVWTADDYFADLHELATAGERVTKLVQDLSEEEK